MMIWHETRHVVILHEEGSEQTGAPFQTASPTEQGGFSQLKFSLCLHRHSRGALSYAGLKPLLQALGIISKPKVRDS